MGKGQDVLEVAGDLLVGRARLSSVAQRARISLLRVKQASEGNHDCELAGATRGPARSVAAVHEIWN